MLAAAAADGVSEIRHAACEPHVVELCEFLRGMGVGITGAGSHTIRVEGVARRNGAKKTLYGDYIEAGSWAVVGAITGGHIEVGGTRPVDMEVVAATLNKMRAKCTQDGDVSAWSRRSWSAPAASPRGYGRDSPATSSAW